MEQSRMGKETAKKLTLACEVLEKEFGNAMTAMKVYDVVNQPNHYYFKIRFIAYEYFCVVVQYDMGSTCSYIEGGRTPDPELSADYRDHSEIDYETFLHETNEEIRIRIPDKYLKAKGWL